MILNKGLSSNSKKKEDENYERRICNNIRSNSKGDISNKRLAITLSAQFLILNGYGLLSGNFINEMENISYHVAANNINKDLLHEIIESFIDGNFDSEELKLKIYESIAEKEFIEV